MNRGRAEIMLPNLYIHDNQLAEETPDMASLMRKQVGASFWLLFFSFFLKNENYLKKRILEIIISNA